MTRYFITTRIAILAGLASVAALALSAAPTGATLVCQPGHTSGPYCTNVLPAATTQPATDITATSATLNGISGPDVAGGDVTHYVFDWGLTTAYGATTRTGTVTGCATGVTNPADCTKTVAVSATIRNLSPGQTYHFRIVSTNADGTTTGADQTFTTLNLLPIKSVTVTPTTVRPGRTFIVVVTLTVRARLRISLLSHRNVVSTFNEGRRSGTVRKAISAPFRRGVYTVRVRASARGTSQTVIRNLTVT